MHSKKFEYACFSVYPNKAHRFEMILHRLALVKLPCLYPLCQNSVGNHFIISPRHLYMVELHQDIDAAVRLVGAQNRSS